MVTTDRLALYKESISDFKQLLDESSEFAYEKYGLTLLYSLEVNLTSEQLHKLGAKTRQDEIYFYNKGTIEAQSGNFQEAIKNLKSAVELNPDFIQARYNLALAICDSGDYDQAVKELKKLQKEVTSEREAQEIASYIEDLKLKKQVE